jgi:hypothetical protein
MVAVRERELFPGDVILRRPKLVYERGAPKLDLVKTGTSCNSTVAF